MPRDSAKGSCNSGTAGSFRQGRNLRSLRLPGAGTAGKLGMTVFPAWIDREILLLTAATTTIAEGGAAGDGRDNADGVAIFGGRIFFRQVANVLVVDIHVHKAAQLAILGKQMLAQVAEFRG